MTLSSLTVTGLANFLIEKGFSEDIVFAFEENGIDGETFCDMSDSHMKEVAPRIAERVKLKRIQDGTSIEVRIHVTNAVLGY